MQQDTGHGTRTCRRQPLGRRATRREPHVHKPWRQVRDIGLRAPQQLPIADVVLVGHGRLILIKMRFTAIEVGRMHHVACRSQAVGSIRHTGTGSKHGVKQHNLSHGILLILNDAHCGASQDSILSLTRVVSFSPHRAAFLFRSELINQYPALPELRQGPVPAPIPAGAAQAAFVTSMVRAASAATAAVGRDRKPMTVSRSGGGPGTACRGTSEPLTYWRPYAGPS